ncbi:MULTISPECIES: GNVR domain-containing protein [Dasania]
MSQPAAVTKELAFALLQKNLNSIAMATAYFKQDMEGVYRQGGDKRSVAELVRGGFLKSLGVTKPDKGSEYLAVTYQYMDPRYTAKWLNGYISYVDNKTRHELLKAAIDNKVLAINEYKKQVASLRSVYEKRLQDRIVLLEEAYSIAKQLGFEKPVSSNAGNKILISNLDESLLYMRGSEVLRAELDALKSRTQRDSFIPDIRFIQEKITYLESLTFNVNEIKVVNIDGWAVEPESSVKPKKALVLVLAGMLGGLLGVFVVLIQWAIDNRKYGE